MAGDARTASQIATETGFTGLTNLDPSNIRHVALGGVDQPSRGTVAAPWATIAYAVSRLQPGQTLFIHAGTYNNMVVTLDGAVDGSSSAPITIMGAIGESKPILVGSPIKAMFTVTKSYWILRDLTIDMNNQRQAAVLFTTAGAHHSALIGSEVRRSTNGTAIQIEKGAHDIVVRWNKIHDNYQAQRCDEPVPEGCGTSGTCESSSNLCVGTLNGSVRTCSTHSDCGSQYFCSYENICRKRADAHAVGVIGESRDVTVEENTMFDNSGDAIQCQGPATGGGGTTRPYNITFKNNTAYGTASARGVVENAVDIKDCDQVSVSGGNFYGFYEPKGESSNQAIVMHFGANKVLVEDVKIHDSCGGIGTGNSANDQVTNLVFRRNRFYGLGSGCPKSSGGIVLGKTHEADIGWNTFHNITGAGISLAEQYTQAGMHVGEVYVFNNIFSNVDYSMGLAWLYAIDIETFHNLHYRSSGAPQFRCQFNAVGLEDWHWCGNERGDFNLEYYGTQVGSPLFVTNPEVNDFYTQPLSPARNSATAYPGKTVCGGAGDIGALESDC
ncbi:MULTISPECIES: right-handed parallel beta-helix repeat-containing protein [Myxococcaceae]|uniref:right-handed parallel beta-helix repeat-containing protein n=1 Tax=Myxococcaceae TaxID=31 RepID=UPI001890A0A9|nr:right-handed parallel beta-helix repeat-containing protein [Simulacricoccus sp. 17bor-14]